MAAYEADPEAFTSLTTAILRIERSTHPAPAHIPSSPAHARFPPVRS